MQYRRMKELEEKERKERGKESKRIEIVCGWRRRDEDSCVGRRRMRMTIRRIEREIVSGRSERGNREG